ncbi:phosphate ABC transporter permease PstA [Sphaerobacter thermophilus]|uniref:phosphate ABC transporter permease PstA n=1 Tax=Sphaerobacter thermophilus TaxID=2057 RepID=UPI0039C138E9
MFDTVANAASVRYRRRVWVNRLMLGLTIGSTAVALVPLVLILSYVVRQGVGALSVGFFTETFRPVTIGVAGGAGGVLHAIVGSALIVGAALLLAAPLGILAGIYLAEYRSGPAATVIRFCTDVLSAMPSIVVGVTAYVLIVQRTRQFSGLAGSIALAVLMVPVITRTTEEILQLVPQSVREAAAALGAPRWWTTLTVVLPAALGGIATGVLLAMARAAGETAPLLVTVLGNNQLTFDIFGPMQALPLLAYRYTEQPFAVLNEQAWGAALILVVLVLGTNILVRALTRRRAG